MYIYVDCTLRPVSPLQNAMKNLMKIHWIFAYRIFGPKSIINNNWTTTEEWKKEQHHAMHIYINIQIFPIPFPYQISCSAKCILFSSSVALFLSLFPSSHMSSTLCCRCCRSCRSVTRSCELWKCIFIIIIMYISPGNRQSLNVNWKHTCKIMYMCQNGSTIYNIYSCIYILAPIRQQQQQQQQL